MPNINDAPRPNFRGVRKFDSENVPVNGKIEADVVIIGGGGAGIPAAVSAYENGAKKVVLIEKRGKAGGNAVMARGIFGCETKILRKAMVHTDKDEIFRNAVRWHHYSQINPKIIRAYINQSGDTIEWILDKGIEMHVDTTTRMNYNQDPTWHCVNNGSMALVMGKLMDEAMDMGMKAFFETEATEIIIQNGKVSGVRAVKDGEEFIIEAANVILTTGGFLSNEERVKNYFPYYSKERFGGFMVPNKGEGIALAEKAGAATEYYCTLIREACAASDKAPRILSEFVREPYHMWVNKKGRRFVEETAGAELQICTNALMMQPEMKAFAIFDDMTLQYMMDKGFELAKGDEYRGTSMPWLRDKLKEIALKHSDSLIVAESIDELADWIGAKKEDLEDEISKYNSYCENGYDKDFYKERRYLAAVRKAPFYAILHQAIAVDTIGPVRIDHEMQVLNKDYDPIPGLYSAGVITAGWQSNDYCGQYLFGSALSYSINSGRIAGKNAAKRLMEVQNEKNNN
jgi:fumarate reductase flavoprotein subunit